MGSRYNTNLDATAIYEGGGVAKITAEEIKGNEVAVRQLINAHNLAVTENKNKETEIQTINAQNEYLKTSPFVSIISALINVGGSVLIAVGVNLITGKEAGAEVTDIVILVTGILLVVIGSLANILYPFARGWFNEANE